MGPPYPVRNRLSPSWRSPLVGWGSPGRRLGDQHRQQRRRIRTERRSVTAEVRRGSRTLALETLPPATSPSGAGVTMAAALARLEPARSSRFGFSSAPSRRTWNRRGTGAVVRGEGSRLPPRWGSSPFCPALTVFFFHCRTFLQAVSSEKVRCTNLNCSVIADVRHDGSEPCVDVLFGGFRWESGGSPRLSRALGPGPAVLVPDSFSLRRWASLDYARRSPDAGNAHCFRLPHPG